MLYNILLETEIKAAKRFFPAAGDLRPVPVQTANCIIGRKQLGRPRVTSGGRREGSRKYVTKPLSLESVLLLVALGADEAEQPHHHRERRQDPHREEFCRLVVERCRSDQYQYDEADHHHRVCEIFIYFHVLLLFLSLVHTFVCLTLRLFAVLQRVLLRGVAEAFHDAVKSEAKGAHHYDQFHVVVRYDGAAREHAACDRQKNIDISRCFIGFICCHNCKFLNVFLLLITVDNG